MPLCHQLKENYLKGNCIPSFVDLAAVSIVS